MEHTQYDIEDAKLSVAELFKKASQHAIEGNFLKSRSIVSDLILFHPQATSIDIQRAYILQADALRRDGNPQLALRVLTQIRDSEPLVQIEKCMARAQCLSTLANESVNAMRRVSLLKKAALLQQHVVKLAATMESSISTDKRIYYLIVQNELLVRLMKESGATLNSVIESNHQACERLSQSFDLLPLHKDRLAWELPFDQGLYFSACGKLELALEKFSISWNLLKSSNNLREKTWIALSIAACCSRAAPNSPLHREVLDFLVRFEDRYLIDSDRSVLQFFLA